MCTPAHTYTQTHRHVHANTLCLGSLPKPPFHSLCHPCTLRKASTPQALLPLLTFCSLSWSSPATPGFPQNLPSSPHPEAPGPPVMETLSPFIHSSKASPHGDAPACVLTRHPPCCSICLCGSPTPAPSTPMGLRDSFNKESRAPPLLGACFPTAATLYHHGERVRQCGLTASTSVKWGPHTYLMGLSGRLDDMIMAMVIIVTTTVFVVYLLCAWLCAKCSVNVPPSAVCVRHIESPQHMVAIFITIVITSPPTPVIGHL